MTFSGELKPMLDKKEDKDYQAMLFDVKYDKEQFKDPETIGLLMYRLARERENTNKLFQEILSQLALMKEALQKSPEKSVINGESTELISDVDRRLLDFIRAHGKVDAEVVQNEFDYKGKNAASARLNVLYRTRLVQKGRAGKKVLYWVEP